MTITTQTAYYQYNENSEIISEWDSEIGGWITTKEQESNYPFHTNGFEQPHKNIEKAKYLKSRIS